MKSEKNNGEMEKKYYIGLDIGTDSVGYAAVDERYNLLKYKGEAMWGAHLFDPANQSAERRGFRTARRRLDRRQQRVKLVDEIFAAEVAKIDPGFYVRRKESALYREDKTNGNDPYVCFNDTAYKEADYYRQYPTIHHLICDLMESTEKKFDIRLINIAIDWLVAHRGHFLNEIGTDKIDSITDFTLIYDDFIAFFQDRMGVNAPWDRVDSGQFGLILKKKIGVNAKKKELTQLLFPQGIPDDDNYFLNRKELIAFLAGGKIKCKNLFPNSSYEDDLTMTISEDMEVLLPQLGDDAEVIAKIAAMYDWSILSDILSGRQYLSQAKVEVYEKHKKDLEKLKKFVKKYAPAKYNEIFRMADSKVKNYTAYSYNFKSVKKGQKRPDKKADKKEFYDFLRKTLDIEKIICDCEEDEVFLEELKRRTDANLADFLPKQIDSDNRVIPYQLYWVELCKILDNAKVHYAFLEEKDAEGYSNVEKIKSIFKFKIPYYVGPLRKNIGKNPFGWIERKAGVDGKIYPWNFEQMVDLDGSEKAFIDRMTNTCTYIPGEDVLPKWSVLYSKYMVLNEINNIRCNGIPISVEAKQGIYNDLFSKSAKVTPKKIREYLIANGFIRKEDTIGGLDEVINSSLKPLYEFRNLLERKVLSLEDVDEIVKRSTYTEDKIRYKKWIQETFSQLSEEDRKYVARLKYKDFGRLSEYFLNGLEGADRETGECGTIIHFLWGTNENLMQLLSERYTFMENIRKMRNEYYLEHHMTMNEQMEDLGISNAVKRPVKRTMDVVKDIVSSVGYAPAKIFVEMARGPEEQKKRTVTRKDQLLELYKVVEEDTRELERQLEAMGDTANNQLQSDALFLYYLQLGKCMYSGRPIDIGQLKTTKYNIDHIYPQSLVKDDSILNNRVLVESEINGDKKDVYPIAPEIRRTMYPFWKKLADSNLITKEKFARLIRNTGFSEEEKLGFINRQLVETRQSTKAVTQLLNSLYPDTEIVFVKARLASEFRQEFLSPKSRLVNDLHHAKDAYLNVVVGNVYHEKFTKKWFHVNERYSIKTKTIFTNDLVHGEEIIWDSKNDLPNVIRTHQKNNIHLTRYAFCQKGGLFDQNPLKKSDGLYPLKKGMETGKYGGYNKTTAAFFVVARYLKGGKKEVSFVPVDLMYKKQFLEDEGFALNYLKKVLEKMNTKKIEKVELPLGRRIIKYKTTLSLDGFRVWINGKASGGKQILLTSAESLVLPQESIEYIKHMENYSEKKKFNKNLMHDESYDKLSPERNLQLYEELIEKLGNAHFRKMPGNQHETLASGREKFIHLEFDAQIKCLLTCVELLKSGRTGGCDMTAIGGKASSGVLTMGANLSVCKYQEVLIEDVSPAGIHRKTSCNLKDLLL